MDNIIVYVDDADYAEQILRPLLTVSGTRRPTRWIVVGCTPRVTHRVSKWVTHRARESWRGKWAERVFARVVPLLQAGGDAVITELAETALTGQTELLIREHGASKVLDARRPKLAHDLRAAPIAHAEKHHGLLRCAAALASAGLAVTTD